MRHKESAAIPGVRGPNELEQRTFPRRRKRSAVRVSGRRARFHRSRARAFGQLPCEMYTARKVSRLLHPVALWLSLALGVLPAASLACLLVCAPSAAHEHHQGTHDHTAVAAESASITTDGPGITAPSQRCDHTATVTSAVTSTGMKLPAPLAAVRVPGIAPPPRQRATVLIAAGTHSPPGAQSRPLSLRI